jgi:hypothetical protein
MNRRIVGRRRKQRVALHEEINQLPRAYRTAVVLCDLVGLPIAEAARQLRQPLRRFEQRLSLARDQLQARMARRGIMISDSPNFRGASGPLVPTRLVESTVEAAARWRLSQGSTTIPEGVAEPAGGVPGCA